jgi:hypothetical protein
MYTVQFTFSLEGQSYPQGDPFHCSTGEEAVIKALLYLTTAISNCDFVVMELKDNSTVIYFWEDPSVQIQITPNVLTKGVTKVGPKSLKTGMSVGVVEL